VNPLLNQDFLDILTAFTEENVEYMVVGGWAIAFYGYIRGTGDFDIWIRASEENAQRTWQALLNFGAPLRGISVNDFHTLGTVYQMGLPPNRIDVINEIEGVEFDAAWPHRTWIELKGLKFPLIGKRELLENKKAMNRPKDQGDIAWLKKNL
jgi:hypothetical protein